jgi:serine/threonine-protein kinase
MTLATGDNAGAYRILEELGRGGMGRVYKVEHKITRRLEAMKVLEGGRPDVPEQAVRSLREIQLQASLDHPNIAAVHNAFWSGEDLVLVMELVEGCSLGRLMAAGRIPLAAAIDYACQALSALSCAHAHGVIHRDVSPSNILVTRTGVVKLTDFGLSGRAADARLSQGGSPAGSPHYMSPEQVREAAKVDARSDLYSLGVVLYEMVTGQRPFDSGSAFTIMMDHVKKAPKAPLEIEPGLPAALNRAILRALATASEPGALLMPPIELR